MQRCGHHGKNANICGKSTFLKGEESVDPEGEEDVRPEGRRRRVNIFKQMWLENMIKASKGIYKEED